MKPQKPTPTQIDLTKDSALSSMIQRWCMGDFKPDQFAALMSALLDCKTDLERQEALHMMIEVAFQNTPFHYEAQKIYRQKVRGLFSFSPVEVANVS